MRLFVDGLIFQKQKYGGISRLFREILPRMCKLDDDLEIILFIEGNVSQNVPIHDRITLRNVPFVQRGHTPLNNFLREYAYPIYQLARKSWDITRSTMIGRGRNSIWHSTYYTYPRYWKGTQILTVYDLAHELFPDLYDTPLDDITRLQKRECINRADTIICISETTKRDLIKYYNIHENLFVIQIGCSEVFKYQPLSLKKILPIKNRSFFLFVGNRSHYKNFEFLINAYSQWNLRKDITLVTVGNPFTEAELKMIDTKGINEHVILYSNLSDEELCNLYNQAIALVYPTMYEGFGIPLLEAMACGCPIIASKIASTQEVARDFPIYFELGKRESLITSFNAAIRLHENPEFKEKGFAISKQYSWDHTARQTLDVYYKNSVKH
jgi:glycosyltransferase involved in cell wall biosynthesis